jgi:hypothetical protein
LEVIVEGLLLESEGEGQCRELEVRRDPFRETEGQWWGEVDQWWAVEVQ